METEAFIRCEGLVKTYHLGGRELFALQGLNLSIQRGELLGIVGASGSGKSTLMNILGGLDRPCSGRVWVDGMDLQKMNEAALDQYRSSRVGFVWQQGARNLIHYLSAEENVMLPITINGGGQRAAARRAAELLEKMGLSTRRRHRLEELSGGEQQRVAIAVALVNHPVLLLADEPTGEVDTATAAGIYKIFQDLNQNQGLTILIVSHDQAISRYMERVVAIRDGRTAEETLRLEEAALAQATVGTGLPLPDQPTQPPSAPPVFEEVVLMDAKGHLQLPDKYLQQLNYARRLRLEVNETGVLIAPALLPQTSSTAPALPGQPAPAPEKLNLWERLRQPAPTSPRGQP